MSYREEGPDHCGDCAAAPGQYHVHGCDVERCARCGFQAIGCDCIYDVNDIDTVAMEWTHPEIYNKGPTEEMHDRWDKEWGSRRLRWTGFWPGSLEAAALGWFSVFGPDQKPPVRGWVQCTKDTPGARPDLNRFFSRCKWDPEKQIWIAPS